MYYFIRLALPEEMYNLPLSQMSYLTFSPWAENKFYLTTFTNAFTFRFKEEAERVRDAANEYFRTEAFIIDYF